jgi:predicted phage-related endonuclease
VIREIICDQGTPEWHMARAGIPTASEFATVMAKGKGKGGGDSVTRRKYMLTLLGERLTGEVVEGYSNHHMERGKVMEVEARTLYLFRTGTDLRLAGFFVNDEIGAGASPDSVIGEDGLVEIKTKLPALQLELQISGGLPAEHKAQVQGQLLVTGRQWVDFVSYWPKLPAHIVRVERDEPYIATLKQALADFNGELQALTERFTEAA